MFAAGRILRNNRRLSSVPGPGVGGLLVRQRQKERRKFRCYMPFMWSAMIMSCVGLIVILTGTAMCFTGYYFGAFSTDAVVPPHSDQAEMSVNVSSVPDNVSLVEDPSAMATFRGLIYAGPVVMSFGCFAIVFACVIVCETRDRALEIMDDNVRRGNPELPAGGLRPDFYTLVVEHRLRRLERQRRRRRQRQQNINDEYDQLTRTAATETVDGAGDSGTQVYPVINIYSDDEAAVQVEPTDVTGTSDVIQTSCRIDIDSVPPVDVVQPETADVIAADRLSTCSDENELKTRLLQTVADSKPSVLTRCRSAPCVTTCCASTVPQRIVITTLNNAHRHASISAICHLTSGADLSTTLPMTSHDAVNMRSSSGSVFTGHVTSSDHVTAEISPPDVLTPAVAVHAASVEQNNLPDMTSSFDVRFCRSVADVSTTVNNASDLTIMTSFPSDDVTVNSRCAGRRVNGLRCSSAERDDSVSCDNVFQWPLVDLETRLDRPVDDTSQSNGPSPKHRRLFGLHRPLAATVSGPALLDNVSNRFRRRRRVLDSSAAAAVCQAVSGLVDTCAISSAIDSRQFESDVEMVSRCNTAHATSTSFTALRRHYFLSRMRQWKAKRSVLSAATGSNTSSVKPRSATDISRNPLCNGGPMDATLAVTSSRPPRATRIHRYRLPVLSFNASKSRLQSRGRNKRPLSPVDTTSC